MFGCLGSSEGAPEDNGGRTAEGRRALEDGFRYLIYRVGPYYVVPVQPTDVSGVLQEGHEIVNVFRAVTLEFVGDYLW